MQLPKIVAVLYRMGMMTEGFLVEKKIIYYPKINSLMEIFAHWIIIAGFRLAQSLKKYVKNEKSYYFFLNNFFFIKKSLFFRQPRRPGGQKFLTASHPPRFFTDDRHAGGCTAKTNRNSLNFLICV
jgi:hypothetical protein